MISLTAEDKRDRYSNGSDGKVQGTRDMKNYV